MRLDALGLEFLPREDCLALLATVPLGRVIFTDRALPAGVFFHALFAVQ